MTARVGALAASLLLVACSIGTLENSPLGGGELTVDKESEVTADVARQIRAAVPLVGDPVLLAYLNEIGQAIVRVTEPQPFVYRFALLEDDSLNAFTIGGGYVYLNTGVLAQSGDVAELAGVLAHEIAHVRQRHIAKRSEGQGLATLATIATLAAVALGGGDPALIAIPQGLNVALQLKHSRRHESEADREGLGYMLEAGFDARGMMRFFERILAASPSRGAEIPPYLYSHPAVRERIAAARAHLARLGPHAELVRRDARLADMQARLAALAEPIAGGSGLLARPEFDRARSDPLLVSAKDAHDSGDGARADTILAEAEALEPNDPRLPMRRADLAEERGDLEDARTHLQRAFELDPAVPIVHHRLGNLHRRLGNRTQAVFYLEQAIANFRPGTPARRRAELDIDLISLPLFDASGLSTGSRPAPVRRVARGEQVRWSANLSRRFLERNPRVRVEWRDPDGVVAQRNQLRMSPLGGFSSEFDTSARPLGRWSVHVEAEGSAIEDHGFVLEAAIP